MSTRKGLLISYLFILVVVFVGLAGCRAFKPEAVIVNQPPETFITGAPGEESGGYFHYHMFWYGSDEDGRVERFVWALTDSTIQDDDTDEDEEDSRFNPALHINTLDIGNWTTRTDTVFDFQIGLGSLTSVDKTFHIVAMDDRGDYDRTPARLYFLTNALGTPFINYVTEHEDGTIVELAHGQVDTFGYGKPFALGWSGETPNIRSRFIDPETGNVEGDTIPPFNDGLYGFKYRLSLGDCDDSTDDCWLPRRFDESVNDSVSYFWEYNRLEFANDGSGMGVNQMLIADGAHSILVNTIDVAGVEVTPIDRRQEFVVNFDPDTYLISGSDPIDVTDPFGDDELVYPHYTVWSQGQNGLVESETFPFGAGDRVPHRAKVVFKALGWDDSRDSRLFSDPDSAEVYFQSKIDGLAYFTGSSSRYPFSTQYNEIHKTPEWNEYEAVSADTVSFLTGPVEYVFKMRTVDEHGRRDSSADSLSFVANFDPEVEFIEIIADDSPTAFEPGQPYPQQPDTLFMCIGDENLVPDGWNRIDQDAGVGFCFANPVSGSIEFHGFPPPTPDPEQVSVFGSFYKYEILIHANDHEQERLFDFVDVGGTLEPKGDPDERLLSWKMDVRSENDPDNLVNDGDGYDDIETITSNAGYVDDYGIRHIEIEVFVPSDINAGSVNMYQYATESLPSTASWLLSWVAETNGSEWDYNEDTNELTVYASERTQFLNKHLPLTVRAGNGSGEDLEEVYSWLIESVVDMGNSVVLTASDDLNVGPEGLEGYNLQLRDESLAWSAVKLTMPQFGVSNCKVIARDATRCADGTEKTCRFPYYSELRVPENHHSDPSAGAEDILDLNSFCGESDIVQKMFGIYFVGEIDGVQFIYPPLN